LNSLAGEFFGIIDVGRHLGPAPRSKSTTVEKQQSGASIRKDVWKNHTVAVNIL